jgi:hypothetical protein
VPSRGEVWLVDLGMVQKARPLSSGFCPLRPVVRSLVVPFPLLAAPKPREGGSACQRVSFSAFPPSILSTARSCGWQARFAASGRCPAARVSPRREGHSDLRFFSLFAWAARSPCLNFVSASRVVDCRASHRPGVAREGDSRQSVVSELLR